MAKLLGIDVGGTFTDLFYLDEATGRVSISKASTTPRDLSVGLFDAMGHIGVSAGDIDLFIHGTTMATNAIIERKGARCGLITTLASGTSRLGAAISPSTACTASRSR